VVTAVLFRCDIATYLAPHLISVHGETENLAFHCNFPKLKKEQDARIFMKTVEHTLLNDF